MAMEKLGVENQELIEELQCEYNRIQHELHEEQMRKTASSSSRIALLTNELDQIKSKLDSLQE